MFGKQLCECPVTLDRLKSSGRPRVAASAVICQFRTFGRMRVAKPYPNKGLRCRILRRKVASERRFVRRLLSFRAISPKLVPRVPIRAQVFVVCYRILNDESFYACRVR